MPLSAKGSSQTKGIEKEKKRFLELLKKGAFCKEKVILSSGKESDYYIDARRVTLSAEGAFLCAKIIWDMIKDDRVDALGGPTLGADPIVGALAFLSFQMKQPLPTFIVRKAPKSYGKQKQIEGPLLRAESRIVLIDDVATTGKSITEAIDILKSFRVNVVKAICIVDRKEGAREALAKKNCPLFSIFSISDFPI